MMSTDTDAANGERDAGGADQGGADQGGAASFEELEAMSAELESARELAYRGGAISGVLAEAEDRLRRTGKAVKSQYVEVVAIGAAVIACAVALGVYLNPASLGLCQLP